MVHDHLKHKGYFLNVNNVIMLIVKAVLVSIRLLLLSNIQYIVSPNKQKYAEKF